MEKHNIILTESQVAEIQRRLKAESVVDKHLDEAISEEVSTEDINTKPFEPKNTLNPKLWYNNKLNSKVRLRLLDIADEFVEDLNIKWVKPEDIVITGSMANYNWNKYSDIDLHVIMDYKKIFRRTDFVEDYFKTKKNVWSSEHENLKIYGFPVEIFVEDSNVPAESSGVYSLEKNEWIKEPQDLSDATLNKDYVKRYCADTINDIDDIIESLDGEKDNKKAETKYKKLSRIFERLKALRKNGLATKAKEMSSGNIIWKVLRAAGYIDKLLDAKHKAYDREMSITETAKN